MSGDELSYYLNDIQVYTLFEFSPLYIDESESMILFLKESESHISTYIFQQNIEID